MAARAEQFLMAAFAVLREQYVIPRPRATPFVAVGTDYLSSDIHALREHAALESEIEAAYPQRFGGELRPEKEFATIYINSLLMAAVARAASDDDYTPSGRGVTRAVEELEAALDSADYELIAMRTVSHLGTIDDRPLTVAGVEVIPETGQDPVHRIISERLPGAGGVLDRDTALIFDPPYSVLRVDAKSTSLDPEEPARELSQRLGRFMLGVRLLHASTAQAYYEVWGINSLVARLGPQVRRITHGTLVTSVRREVVLDASQGAGIEALSHAIGTTTARPADDTPTSFELAVGRFQRSFSSTSPYDQLLDLTTCLEGLLIASGGEKEGLGLRLSSRSAALLATESDCSASIFTDVKALYDLRSMIVHGSRLSQSQLIKTLGKISTVPPEGGTVHFAERLGHAVDRLRDIVRRSVLCRMGLALGDDPLWPLASPQSIDAILASDDERGRWRSYWHDELDVIGASGAGQKAPRAVGQFAPRER